MRRGKMTVEKCLVEYQDTELNPRNKIKTHKNFADCRFKLPITETKLLLGLMSLVKQADNEFRTFRFSLSSLADFLGMKNERRIYEIRDVIESLKDRELILPEEDLPERERPMIHWLSRCQIAESRDYVELKLNPELHELLLSPAIDTNFLTSRMSVFLQMQSRFALKFYLLLLKYFWISDGQIRKNKFIMTIAEIKNCLAIDPSLYPRSANLKARVLEIVRKECDEFGELSFTYEPMKKGASVIGWHFTIFQNPNYKPTHIDLKPISSRTTGAEKYTELLNKAVEGPFKEVIPKLIDEGVTRNGILEIIQCCTPSQALSAIHQVKASKGTKNKPGAIRQICREYASQDSSVDVMIRERAERLRIEQETKKKKTQEEAAAKIIAEQEKARRSEQIREYISKLSAVRFTELLTEFQSNASEFSLKKFKPTESTVPGTVSYLHFAAYLENHHAQEVGLDS